jgi:hypothetical protein
MYKIISEVSLVAWLDETIIYHQGSGDTHLFESIPTNILNIIFSASGFYKKDLTNVYDFYDQLNSEIYVDGLLQILLQKDLISQVF